MSEYQYYEFQAIDRRLTAAEMTELRAFSTRALITPTSFVNDYQWGSFKGNEKAWMEKYFDAFLYFANWGTHTLELAVPSRLLDGKTVRRYCLGESASVRERNGRTILTFIAQDDEPADEWDDQTDALSALIPIRAQLARGDLRSLYIGWLRCAQVGELDDSDTEPPVPAGLGDLDGSLDRLVDFLRVDTDLLETAAAASAGMAISNSKARTVGSLLSAAESASDERRRAAAARAKIERKRREEEAAARTLGIPPRPGTARTGGVETGPSAHRDETARGLRPRRRSAHRSERRRRGAEARIEFPAAARRVMRRAPSQTFIDLETATCRSGDPIAGRPSPTPIRWEARRDAGDRRAETPRCRSS